MQIARRKSGIKYVSLSLLAIWLLPTVCGAGDYPITVDFTGEYVNETCEVSVNGGSNSETVSLPLISTTALSNSGGEGGKTGFNVTLNECAGNQAVLLRFNSNYSSADTLSGNLLNQTGGGYSKNLQLRLRKEDNSQMIIDDLNTADRFEIREGETPVTHQYYVTYYSGSDGPVTAGKVYAVAGITLEYE